jgi:hypothetical protein
VVVSAGYLLTLLTTIRRGSLKSLAENCPLTALGEAEEAEESRLSDSVAALAGDLLTTMCRGSLRSLADSENGPVKVLGEAEESRPSVSVAASASDLMTTMHQVSLRNLADLEDGPLTVLGEAEEAEENRLSDSVAALACGDLLTTLAMRQGSLRRLADSEDGSLTVLGEAEEAEESRPSGPGVTLLAILGSVVHSPTLLMTPGRPVGVGGCRCACAVPLCVSPSALIYLSSPGLAVVHGPAQARSVTPNPMGPTVSATQQSHPLLLSNRGGLQVSLVLLQEP